MSRTESNDDSGEVREYNEPEQLDRILVYLREVRKDHKNGKRRTPDYDPVSDKIATPPSEEPVAAETAAEQRATPPAATPAGPAGAGQETATTPVSLPVTADAPQVAAKPAEQPLRPAAAPPTPSAPPVRQRAAKVLGRMAEAVEAKVARPVLPKPQMSAATAAPATAGAASRPSLETSKPAPAPSLAALGKGEFYQAIHASRRAFIATGAFSLVINVLMLAGPLFMLQVYDRVLSSGSLPTLVALALLTSAIYCVIGVLELVRSRIFVRIGIELDRRIGDRVFQASLERSIAAQGSSVMALRELDGLRQFISGPAPITFFDAPWTPIYLLVVFMLHWTLGVAATLGAALLVLLAWIGELRSRAALAQASEATAKTLEIAESGQRNAESIIAMGMLGAYRARWQQSNAHALAWQMLSSDRLGGTTALSKTLRLLLQSLMLAVGAVLAVKGDISAGSIVAGTILFGRALAPVEQAVGHWRNFGKARESFAKLTALLAAHPAPAVRTAMTDPAGRVAVDGLRVAAPQTRTVILSGISFKLEPGQMLGVIGPSASGKSTLARALVGLWAPFGGEIRLDGQRLDLWDPEQLGRHIGYLPQGVELFSGTVRDNISRFNADASDDEIVAAAKAAHAHELIMALPQSYETELGAFGTYLSAGQRQRIGLARALFRNPSLVVLDEPNANLDRAGDEALAWAIDGMRERGQAIVLVSHRVQAIGKADLLLYIEKGQQRAFGPKNDVLRFLQTGVATPSTTGAQQQAAASSPPPAAAPATA